MSYFLYSKEELQFVAKRLKTIKGPNKRAKNAIKDIQKALKTKQYAYWK